MRNLKKLKGEEMGISIANDMTPKQRENNRELVKEAKQKEQTAGDGKYRVVGPPGKQKIVKM